MYKNLAAWVVESTFTHNIQTSPSSGSVIDAVDDAYCYATT
jgi:hypothetical protein